MDSLEAITPHKKSVPFVLLDDDVPFEEPELNGIGPFASGNHPDRDNPNYQRVPIEKFSNAVGISRISAKRLFERGVFPYDWVEKSPGRKWFVYLERDWNRTTAQVGKSNRLELAKRSFARWSIIRRRPDASKALHDPRSTEDLALNLFALRLFDEAPNEDNSAPLTKRILSPRGGRIYNELLNNLKPLAMKPESQAVFQLVEKLIEFKSRFVDRDFPCPQELAELLHCSVASLYRPPFGKTVIKTAQGLIERALAPGSISDLDALDEKYGPRLTARRIRGHLLISLQRAEDLLEDWRLNEAQTNPATNSSFEVDPAEAVPFESTRESTTASMASGYSIHQTKKKRNLSPGELEAKHLRDRTRISEEAMYHLDWELDPRSRGTLYLSALPSRALKTVARYAGMGDRKTPQKKSYDRALAQIDKKREHLGCVIPKEGGFCRRVFCDDGITPERSFPTLIGAVADLHHHLRARPRPKKLHPPDWKALEAKAVHLWTQHTADPKTTVKNNYREEQHPDGRQGTHARIFLVGGMIHSLLPQTSS